MSDLVLKRSTEQRSSDDNDSGQRDGSSLNNLKNTGGSPISKVFSKLNINDSQFRRNNSNVSEANSGRLSNSSRNMVSKGKVNKLSAFNMKNKNRSKTGSAQRNSIHIDDKGGEINVIRRNGELV